MTNKSMKRTLMGFALWLGLVQGGWGCAHAPLGGAVAFRVEANVPDATVLIDDVMVGKVSDWAQDGKQSRHIRPGFHRVELRHPGYYSVFQEIEKADGTQAVIKAELRPLLE
jgi:PEGA domain